MVPNDDEPVRFEQDIKPLFRARDHFDLWAYAHVREHADAILTRLRDGTMPCDGAWPDAQVELFQRWVDAGKVN